MRDNMQGSDKNLNGRTMSHVSISKRIRWVLNGAWPVATIK